MGMDQYLIAVNKKTNDEFVMMRWRKEYELDNIVKEFAGADPGTNPFNFEITPVNFPMLLVECFQLRGNIVNVLKYLHQHMERFTMWVPDQSIFGAQEVQEYRYYYQSDY